MNAAEFAGARAYWVTRNLLAVPPSIAQVGAEPSADSRWRLHFSADAGITVAADRISSTHALDLRSQPGGLPAGVVGRYPHLTGYLALSLRRRHARQAETLLKGQLAVGMHARDESVLAVTGVQIAAVLDALYGRADRRTYGISWRGRVPRVRVWAPTARRVTLLTWPAQAASDAPVSAARRTGLRADRDGSWSARSRGLRSGARYLFEVEVFQPRTQQIEHSLVTDPYSVALTVNSTRSVAIDLADKKFMPRDWRKAQSPPLSRGVDSTIYELHVRDFSRHDESVTPEHRGSYLAFADRRGAGGRHLRRLAQAGLNSIHLLPTFDIASIEEDPARQRTPAGDLSSYPPDSDEQQARIAAVAAEDAFNWGYDPWHWMVPEGSYASSVASAAGGGRVAEFRAMVGALHRSGLRVILDQVFNHTNASGQDSTSVLDKIVPGYYHRLGADGAVQTSTCCQNVATEHVMAQKIMVDAVVLWARHYRVDGFRFDLMGHHSRANLLAVRAGLDRLTRRKDGVDGRSIYLYGEGWNFGEVANNARFTQAVQGQLGGTGIGTFSDRLRDAVRGGSPLDDEPFRQGLATGLLVDPNDAPQPDARARMRTATDLAQLGLAGNLRSYRFTSSTGRPVSGEQVRYNGAAAGYADEPDEVVSYVDAHDNETLFDELAYKLPRSTAMADRIRMNTLALSMTALAQTPCLWHAGTDLLRSKSLDRNSYNSGDWFNVLDWTGANNGFGRGLPPAADNQTRWTYARPLLRDPALKPTAQQVRTAATAAEELLKLRFSSPLFRLGSAALINHKVSFPVSGTPRAHEGVILMRIDDTVGPDIDRALRNVVVVFNFTPREVHQHLPDLAGVKLTLSPIQARGADPVVKTSTWNVRGQTLSIPARTVAVFLQR